MAAATKIILIPKSPWEEGRWGKREKQDWFRGCVLAAEIAQKENGTIIVPTSFTRKGQDESALYQVALIELDVRNAKFPREGNETIAQIDACARIVQDPNVNLVIVSTFSHWPRVYWLTFGIPRCRRRIAWGIPRPLELFTDIIFGALFPIIDICGGRDWFQRKVSARREKGKF